MTLIHILRETRTPRVNLHRSAFFSNLFWIYRLPDQYDDCRWGDAGVMTNPEWTENLLNYDINKHCT